MPYVSYQHYYLNYRTRRYTSITATTTSNSNLGCTSTTRTNNLDSRYVPTSSCVFELYGNTNAPKSKPNKILEAMNKYGRS